MMGTFLALDLFLFYIFWEVVLVPMYFLIGIWGGPRREYAAIKFFLYTLVGSLLMLLGILAVYFGSEPRTFDMTAIPLSPGDYVQPHYTVIRTQAPTLWKPHLRQIDARLPLMRRVIAHPE